MATPSTPSSTSSTPTSSPLSSPSLCLTRLAFVSQTDLEAALERERDAARQMCTASGFIKPGSAEPEGEGCKEGTEGAKGEWRCAVGPRSGRKIGALLRKSSGGKTLLPAREKTKSRAVEAAHLARQPPPPRELLQRVSKSVSAVARRLIFRHVTIASPEYGAKLLETMKEDSALAGFLRTITVKIEAFAKPATFSDLAQDDLLRLAVKATSFDSPIASFAPLKDGRKPLASYPSTLQSCRLGTPFAQTVAGGYGGADTSDNEDEPVGASDATRPSKDYMSLLTSLPTTLRQLKLSQLADNSLPSVPPTSPLRSCHLTALLLDFVTVSPLFLEWLAPATLEKLQLWCVRGLSSFDIVQFVRKQAQLKELMFKPKGHRQGTRLGNELVLYLPVLEHLTLGSGACDHVIYSLLPSSLTHLCVSLPNHHQNARLLPIANEITTRLTSLKVFELYSHLYFPPPVELTYPGPEPNESSGLRELRLSHITATPGEIAAFLSSIGRRLYTLATHHISEEPSSLLEYCPSLRRLELGVTHFEPPSGTSFFRGLSAPLLNFLRVHFNSGVPLSQLLDILPHRAQSGLKTLEFIGIFPDDLPSDWRSGACIEALVEECKRSGIEWWVNGRIVESMGDFWRALVGQTGRETL